MGQDAAHCYVTAHPRALPKVSALKEWQRWQGALMMQKLSSVVAVTLRGVSDRIQQPSSINASHTMELALSSVRALLCAEAVPRCDRGTCAWEVR
jgi:hypothetical protein